MWICKAQFILIFLFIIVLFSIQVTVNLLLPHPVYISFYILQCPQRIKSYFFSKSMISALVKQLSWLEHRLIQQRVVILFPGQGAFLGCRFHHPFGHVQEAADRSFSLTLMFLSLSLSPPLSLKINKNILGWELKEKNMISK